MNNLLSARRIHKILKEHVGEAEAIAFKKQHILARYRLNSPWELYWEEPPTYTRSGESGLVRFVAAYDAWMEVR